jgi:hypothetical protein
MVKLYYKHFDDKAECTACTPHQMLSSYLGCESTLQSDTKWPSQYEEEE